MNASDHLVQCYSDDAFLANVVADYLGAGLSRGEAAIVIATPPHVEAFEARLAANGIDVPCALEASQLVCLDAGRTLARFMVDGIPDRDTFRGGIIAALERVRTAGYARVRCFGEMVDLLWSDNVEATFRLEGLWNEVLSDPRVSLLCAYRLDPFDRQVQGVLREVTRCHSRVLPVENADHFDAAVERAWADVFGEGEDVVTLHGLVVADSSSQPTIPNAQATLLRLRDLSSLLADQVLERGRAYYRGSGGDGGRS
jgi:hypothetical protein